MRLILISFLVVISLPGCSAFFNHPTDVPRYYSKMNSLPPTMEKIPIKIKRELLTQSIGGKKRPVRVIEVFPSKNGPQYRLFDIAKGGPFDQLGLHNVDTILAVDDLLIYDPRLVYSLPQAVLQDKRAEVLVLRDGNLIALQIEIE